MKRIIAFVVSTILLNTIFLSANAASIVVDTGQPFATEWVLNINQSLAAEFSLDQDFTLTDISGYIGGEVAGTASITIYDDAGEIPGAELYTGGVSLELGNAWQGITGQSWFLGAGTYWISFELRSLSDVFTGWMLGSAPFPLANHAYTTHGYIPLDLQGGSEWVEDDNLNIGVRILGNPGVVPVPTAVWLFSSALGLLGWMRRRRK